MQEEHDMQPENQSSQSQEKSKSALLNKTEWQAHLQAWQASGLSQKAFCEQHDLNFNSFSYMCSKLIAKQKTEPSSFAPVKLVPGEIEEHKKLTLENKLGLKLNLPLCLPDHELLRILKLLGW